MLLQKKEWAWFGVLYLLKIGQYFHGVNTYWSFTDSGNQMGEYSLVKQKKQLYIEW